MPEDKFQDHICLVLEKGLVLKLVLRVLDQLEERVGDPPRMRLLHHPSFDQDSGG